MGEVGRKGDKGVRLGGVGFNWLVGGGGIYWSLYWILFRCGEFDRFVGMLYNMWMDCCIGKY